jgi:hypothetical protein
MMKEYQITRKYKYQYGGMKQITTVHQQNDAENTPNELGKYPGTGTRAIDCPLFILHIVEDLDCGNDVSYAVECTETE